MKPRDKPHYVNNREFSLSVVEYVKTANAAAAAETEIPNFIRYTYREEMVMDAVENCLKAIGNYNIEAATRSGNPNAFAYFTQICWYAFLRRIAREKKQQDIKLKYISQSPFEDFAVVNADEESLAAAHMFVDQLKSKIDQLKEKDTYIDAIVKEKKKERKKRDMAANSSDSDLGEIFK